mgnify:CR=1
MVTQLLYLWLYFVRPDDNKNDNIHSKVVELSAAFRHVLHKRGEPLAGKWLENL